MRYHRLRRLIESFKNDQNSPVALVTGGARGIGKAIVKLLAQKGYIVVFCDKMDHSGRETEDEFRQQGLLVDFLQVDLCSRVQTIEMVDQVVKKYKRLDALINNARAGKKISLMEENYENWEETFDVVVKTPFFLAQRIVQEMQKQRRGVIINVGSVAASHIGAESPSYHIAKAGVVQMTRYLAHYAGHWGVRTNCVLPGFIIQDEHLDHFLAEDNRHFREIAEKCQPCHFTGRSIDVANTVAWLCSEEGRFINGAIIYLDGGLTVQDPCNVAFQFGKTNDRSV